MKVIVPLFASLVVLTSATVDCSSTPLAATATSEGVTTTTAATVPVETRDDLRDHLRELLLDRATWTRLYIIDVVGRTPAAAASSDRLVRNERAIGRAIAPFYGEAASLQLSGLLQDESRAARDAVGAAMLNDRSRYDRAKAHWYTTSDRVASFFALESPYLSADGLGLALRAWVNDDIGQAASRVAGDWAKDAADADGSSGQALAVADILTGGIVQQFRGQLRPARRDARAESLHLVMRDLLYARSSLIHEYVVESIAGMPSAETTMNRLQQIETDFGKPLAFFYGGAFGDRVSSTLRPGLDDARSMVNGARQGDATAQAAAKAAWYENADSVAAVFAQKNPRWSRRDLAYLFRSSVDDVARDVETRAASDWTLNVYAADAMRRDGTRIADVLSDGVIAQLAL